VAGGLRHLVLALFDADGAPLASHPDHRFRVAPEDARDDRLVVVYPWARPLRPGDYEWRVSLDPVEHRELVRGDPDRFQATAWFTVVDAAAADTIARLVDPDATGAAACLARAAAHLSERLRLPTEDHRLPIDALETLRGLPAEATREETIRAGLIALEARVLLRDEAAGHRLAALLERTIAGDGDIATLRRAVVSDH